MAYLIARLVVYGLGGDEKACWDRASLPRVQPIHTKFLCLFRSQPMGKEILLKEPTQRVLTVTRELCGHQMKRSQSLDRSNVCPQVIVHLAMILARRHPQTSLVDISSPIKTKRVQLVLIQGRLLATFWDASNLLVRVSIENGPWWYFACDQLGVTVKSEHPGAALL